METQPTGTLENNMTLYDEIFEVGIRVLISGWTRGYQDDDAGHSLVDYYKSEEVTYWKPAGDLWIRI